MFRGKQLVWALFFGVALVVSNCISIVIGAMFGNVQAFNNRYDTDAPKVIKALKACGLEDQFELIRGSKGQPILVGSIDDSHEFTAVKSRISSAYEDSLFSGIDVEQEKEAAH